MQAHDADDAAAFGDGNEGEASACGEAADGGPKGVFRAGDLEGARHDRLHVAVAFVTEGVDDALAADDAHELGAADDGEFVLQGVDAAVERVGERVGGREGGEVGEHNFAHAYGVDDGLEEDALVFDLRADHDEEPGEDEPGALRNDAAEHEGESEHLAEARGGAACGSGSVGAREVVADKAAAIEGIGGQKVKQAEEDEEPDEGAQKMGGRDKGKIEEADIAARAEDGSDGGECGEEIGQRAGGGENELTRAAVGDFLAFRVGVGKEAADGEKEDGAEAQAEPRGHEKACGFAHHHGGHKQKENCEAARPAVGTADGEEHEDEQREEDVDAHFDAQPTAKGD